jgi:hypothetical protein
MRLARASISVEFYSLIAVTDSLTQLSLTARSIVEDGMAPIICEFFPPFRFFQCSGATEAITGAAIKLTNIDAGRFNGHDVAVVYQGNAYALGLAMN